MDMTAQELLDFWLEEVGPKGWYRQDAALDERIRERWGGLWEEACRGGLAAWAATPRECLALVILLDQFPRNMFRGSARAFASDHRALTVAKLAILHGHDQRVEMPERQFFYLPLMHSEVLTDQDKCVRMFLLSGGGENLRHARAHREIIRRFGRFPYRNDVLGRRTTEEEAAFLERGGYDAAFREMAP
jgi:uncharacterized protein (DUF924 family)